MAIVGTPAFFADIAAGDTVSIRATTAEPALGLGGANTSANALSPDGGITPGWLDLQYGWNGPEQDGTPAMGPGITSDPNGGREQVVIDGVVQAGWSVVAVPHGTYDLELLITRTGGFITEPRNIQFHFCPSFGNSAGGTCVASAPDGGSTPPGNQTITIGGANVGRYVFSAADIGRGMSWFGGGMDSGNAVINGVIDANNFTINNPAGTAGNKAVNIGLGNGSSAVAVAVNGTPVSITPALGDSLSTIAGALRNAINLLSIPNLTAYRASNNQGGLGASVGPRRQAVTILGSGLASLTYPDTTFLDPARSAQVRFWNPNVLFSQHPYITPWAWSIASAPPPDPIEITTTTLVAGATGELYDQPIEATGGTESGYVWELAAGELPPGMVLANSGTPETSISGTTTQPGSYPITVRVTDDDDNTTTRDLVLVVAAVAPVVIESHCVLALDRLRSQYREQQRFEALICGYADRFDVLEQAIAQIGYFRGIDRSFGVRMDWIAELYRVLREGRTDSALRPILRGHARRVSARGTPDDILGVMRAALEGTGVSPSWTEAYPAGFVARVDGVVEEMARTLAQLVRRAKPLAVRPVLWWTPPGPVSLFGWATSVPPAGVTVVGWSASTPPTTDPSGRWARAF